MKINLSNKEIFLVEKSLINLAKNEEGNNFYDIVKLMNKLISAEEKGIYYTIKETDVPDKTVKRVEKDNGIMIAEYIKELHNFSGETIYRDRNEYTIGTHRVILKSISTEIDNNIITDIVTYSIDYGDITGELTVKSRNGKVLKIDEHNNHYNIMIEKDLVDKVKKKHRNIEK